MTNPAQAIIEEQTPPQALTGKMILGKYTTQLIYVAAKLKLADLLEDGPRHVDDLSNEAGAHAPNLYRVMRFLAGLGIFTEIEPRIFALTPMADVLRTKSPVSQRNLALLMGSEFHNLAWSNIMHPVLTGESAFKNKFGQDFFSYLEKNSESRDILQGVMSMSSEYEADELCNAYDFSAFQTVVDVGGGRGMLIAKILEKYEALQGVLFDSPFVVEDARASLTGLNLGNRLSIIGGDFLKLVPEGGDLIILKRVIHDWDDDSAVVILKNCCKALPQNGRLIIAEQVIQPDNEPSFGKMTDMEMLVMSEGGKERTLEEFKQLMEQSGLRLRRVIESRSYSILEAEVK